MFLFLGIKISLNDLLIKAVAATLQYIPEVNLNVVSHPEGDDFQIMPSIDISVAVATEEGLITPIVKNVPSLSLPDISSTVKDLALRGRNGQLKLDEFQVIEIKFERRICQYKEKEVEKFIIFSFIHFILLPIGRNIYNFQSGNVWNKRIHSNNKPTTVRNSCRR